VSGVDGRTGESFRSRYSAPHAIYRTPWFNTVLTDHATGLHAEPDGSGLHPHILLIPFNITPPSTPTLSQLASSFIFLTRRRDYVMYPGFRDNELWIG
jgi:hypothetical protein